MSCTFGSQLAGLFNSTGEVYRRDGSVNDLGELTDVWDFVQDFECHFNEQIEGDRRTAPGLLDKPIFRMTCSRDVDLVVEDRVVIAGVAYRVAALADPYQLGQIWRAILQPEVVAA